MVRWLLASVVVLTATPAASAAVPNICSAMPDSLITAVLGGMIVSRSSVGDPAERRCIWNGKIDGPAGAHPQVAIIAGAGSTEAQARLSAVQQGLHRIKGVNANAYGGSNSSEGGWVTFWHRGVEVEVNVGRDVPAPLAKAKRIANAVLSRL
jgi:hypothetical protein